MRRVLFACLAFAGAIPASAGTWDAFTSFDGTPLPGQFAFATINPDFSGGFGSALLTQSCDIGEICITSNEPVNSAPFASKSLTAGTFGSIIIPDDRLVLHPGVTDNISVAVTFFAPATGEYRIDTLFSIQDISPSGVGISEFFNPAGNGFSDVFLTPVTSLDALTPSYTNSSVRFLLAGEALGYLIDRQGEFRNDATGVKFTVTSVPEPASWALMIAGFGIVGVAARRRGKPMGRLAISQGPASSV